MSFEPNGLPPTTARSRRALQVTRLCERAFLELAGALHEQVAAGPTADGVLGKRASAARALGRLFGRVRVPSRGVRLHPLQALLAERDQPLCLRLEGLVGGAGDPL